MSNADIGWGAVFAIEGTTPGTYVPVAEVKAITLPGGSRDAVDVTHLASPDRYREFIAGLKDGGEASFTLNWVPSATDSLMAGFVAVSGTYQVTAPNGVLMRFSGFFTNYSPPELTPEGPMEASATIKVSGKATLHPAAG